MKRTYLSISEDYKMATVASAVTSREQEVFHYQFNIDNYNAMLLTLPAGPTPTGIDEETAASYALRDELIQRVKSETREQAKAQCILDVLIAKLPADEAQRAALISSVMPKDTIEVAVAPSPVGVR